MNEAAASIKWCTTTIMLSPNSLSVIHGPSFSWRHITCDPSYSRSSSSLYIRHDYIKIAHRFSASVPDVKIILNRTQNSLALVIIAEVSTKNRSPMGKYFISRLKVARTKNIYIKESGPHKGSQLLWVLSLHSPAPAILTHNPTVLAFLPPAQTAWEASATLGPTQYYSWKSDSSPDKWD